MCIFFYVHKIFYLYFEKYIPKKTQEGILTILGWMLIKRIELIQQINKMPSTIRTRKYV